MKILLDTVDVKIIENYYNAGIIYGVTTNPTLAKKFGMPDDVAMVNQIRKAMPFGEIHVEAFGKTAEEIYDNAKRIQLNTRDKNLVFKVPFSMEGVRATSLLKQENFRTNLHLIFSTNQALLASVVESDYICPLVGRLDDIGHDAFENLNDILESYSNSESETQVMVSSVRHPQHVQKAFMIGADVVTVPPGVLEKMFSHPLTSKGYDSFHEDIKMMQVIFEKDIDRSCVVQPETSLKDCVLKMTDNKNNIVLSNISDNNSNKIGVFTMGDFKRLLVSSDFKVDNDLSAPIEDYLNFETIAIERNSTYEDVTSVFDEFDIGHVVIIDKGVAIGCVERGTL